MAIWKMSGDFPSHDDDSDDRLVSANIRKQSRSDYEPGTGA
ncbi:UNVERIFIED_ORG: tat pathway signal sequence domain protein [Clostridioides difficile F501]